MRKLDILSKPPNNFIFQKVSNETTFGGILSLLYFMSALIIFLVYYFNSKMNLSYDITSFVSKEVVLDKPELREEFYKSVRSKTPREIKIDILKNRNGESNKSIKMLFYPQLNYFLEDGGSLEPHKILLKFCREIYIIRFI